VGITLCATVAWLFAIFMQGRRQANVVRLLTQVKTHSGKPANQVTYDFEVRGSTSPQRTPAWLVELFGVDCFADVVKYRQIGISEELWKKRINEFEIINRLDALEELSLFGDTGTDQDLKRLTALRRLRRLDLDFCAMNGTGLKGASYQHRLRVLSMHGSPVSDAGLAVISDCDNLEELDLCLGNGDLYEAAFSTDGLAHLSKLQKLRALHLGGAHITDADLAQIATLSALERLSFGRGHASAAGIMQLRKLKHLQFISIIDAYSPTYIPPGELETALKALTTHAKEFGEAELRNAADAQSKLKGRFELLTYDE
jgi:hypothetical protein